MSVSRETPAAAREEQAPGVERPVVAGSAGAFRPPEVCVVVPTFNERENVEPLVERLGRALAGVDWEVVFVDDDSPDGTAEVVRALGRQDGRVRCVQRIGRRGLSSAVVEGMLTSTAPLLAVIDGDLQHDERLLPVMVQVLRGGEVDIVVGSRYVEGGSVGAWDERRARMSRFATWVAKVVLKAELRDPMSGFFMLTRPAFERTVRRLSTIGFKVLVDVFASAPEPLRARELHYTFRPRVAGESKLDGLVIWEYLELLLDKLVGRFVPVRFLMFALVGGFGLLVHLATLGVAFRVLEWGFAAAQATATLVAMTSNFALNNVLTYRDRRLRGAELVRGLLLFYLVCGVGALANVGIAQVIFERSDVWLLAGVAGAAIGAVWNYAMASTYTWRRRG